MDNANDYPLERLSEGPRNKRTPHCPPSADLAALAAGTVGERERAALLDHTCGCDACGGLVRALQEDFESALTEAEKSEIAGLRTSGGEWQRSFGVRMAGRRRPQISLIFLARAAAVVLCAAASVVGYQQWTERRPARLLAEAYTQDRPFEFRLRGAAFAPVRIAKGGTDSSFQRPPALIAAEADIQNQLQKHNTAPKWLALRAEAELLAHQTEAAIESFTRALEQRPDDPELLAGLGVAHALQAETSRRPVDYGKAVEYLSRSLQVRPGSMETVFNRAIVYERLLLLDEAIQEWQRYLAADPSSAWAGEARQRLANLEVKKNSGPKP